MTLVAVDHLVFTNLRSTDGYGLAGRSSGLSNADATALRQATEWEPGIERGDVAIASVVLEERRRVVCRVTIAPWPDGSGRPVRYRDVAVLAESAFVALGADPFAVLDAMGAPREFAKLEELPQLRVPPQPAEGVLAGREGLLLLPAAGEGLQAWLDGSQSAWRIDGDVVATLKECVAATPLSLRHYLTFVTHVKQRPPFAARFIVVARTAASVQGLTVEGLRAAPRVGTPSAERMDTVWWLLGQRASVRKYWSFLVDQSLGEQRESLPWDEARKRAVDWAEWLRAVRLSPELALRPAGAVLRESASREPALPAAEIERLVGLLEPREIAESVRAIIDIVRASRSGEGSGRALAAFGERWVAAGASLADLLARLDECDPDSGGRIASAAAKAAVAAGNVDSLVRAMEECAVRTGGTSEIADVLREASKSVDDSALRRRMFAVTVHPLRPLPAERVIAEGEFWVLHGVCDRERQAGGALQRAASGADKACGELWTLSLSGPCDDAALLARDGLVWLLGLTGLNEARAAAVRSVPGGARRESSGDTFTGPDARARWLVLRRIAGEGAWLTGASSLDATVLGCVLVWIRYLRKGSAAAADAGRFELELLARLGSSGAERVELSERILVSTLASLRNGRSLDGSTLLALAQPAAFGMAPPRALGGIAWEVMRAYESETMALNDARTCLVQILRRGPLDCSEWPSVGLGLGARGSLGERALELVCAVAGADAELSQEVFRGLVDAVAGRVSAAIREAHVARAIRAVAGDLEIVVRLCVAQDRADRDPLNVTIAVRKAAKSPGLAPGVATSILEAMPWDGFFRPRRVGWR